MHLGFYAAAAAAALVARILLPFFKTLFSPLRSIPGPLVARFTDFWYFLRMRKANWEKDNMALHRKYGEVVRYGPNRYSFCTQEAVKIIYGHGAKFPKSHWYATWQTPNPAEWTLFSDQSISRHSENRRQYQSTYSMSSLISYEPYVDQCTDLFCQRLQELANADMYVDMGHWMQCYAFDVIGIITFSKRLGFLDKGEDIKGVISALEDHVTYASQLGIYSWLHKYVYPVRNWLSGPAGTGRAYVMEFTKDCIADHEEKRTKGIPVDGAEDNETRVDILTKFFKKHAQDPKAFTMHHLAMGCVSNMVAGSETTGNSLSGILYYLLKTPQTFQKLRQEIDERKKQGKIGRFVPFKEAQEMPYLQAVIKEALRLHPSVGVPFERVVPPGGAQIGDYFFPEGTIVGVNAWVMQHDQSVFGPDADEFRPERWMIDDKEKLSLMERNWMPFGLGSRTCIGRHVAMLEMSKLVPRIISEFDFTLAPHLQTGHWETVNHALLKPKGFKVKVAVR